MIGERILNPQELPPYDFLMERVLGKTRNNVDQDQVERLMALISYHETGGTMDPSQRQISQRWGRDEGLANLYPESERFYDGPGRGLFQYELDKDGGSGAGRTAMNNLLIAYGGEVDPRGAYDKLPKWAKKYFNINNPSHYPNPEGDVDFSELTEEQQKILFLADKLEDPKVKLADIGVLADHEWWAEYHHKGADPNVQKFSNDAARYLKGEFRKLHNIE
tara:strand:+ start:238 stop:897 length:660 start_codon:yes stop_codon:yes gene_type:complete